MSSTQTRTQTITSVETELSFHKVLSDEPPYLYLYDHDPPRNYGDEVHPARIHDIRGHEEEFTLDKHGFQIHRRKSAEKDFNDEEKIKSEYYKEVEDLLKEVTGAHKVIIFHHVVRRHKLGTEATLANPGPVPKVHGDQSPNAGLKHIRHHTGDEAEQLLNERAQIINVWRPIGGPVEESPLALSDFRTIDFEQDLIPITIYYSGRDGETLGVKYSENMKFYYKSMLETDEVILIKCFENKLDGRARLSVHSAFSDPTSPKNAKLRESIEVRAMVFTHE